MNVKSFFGTCRRHRLPISLLSADLLEPESVAATRAHMAECKACRDRYAALRQLVLRSESACRNLPELAQSPALRRRWTSAVTNVSQKPIHGDPMWTLGWYDRSKIAWITLAGVWALTLFFRFSAPDTERRIVAPHLMTWREVEWVFKADSVDTTERETQPFTEAPASRDTRQPPPRSKRSTRPSRITQV